MKVFAAVLVLFSAITFVVAGSYGGGGASSGGYSAASIPAPPCPKNYLFSCQPSLTPAPCAQPASAYGSSGAYSENVPTYLNVPVGYQGGYGGGYGGSYGVVQGVPN